MTGSGAYNAEPDPPVTPSETSPTTSLIITTGITCGILFLLFLVCCAGCFGLNFLLGS